METGEKTDTCLTLIIINPNIIKLNKSAAIWNIGKTISGILK